jgi:hypothetical protein
MLCQIHQDSSAISASTYVVLFLARASSTIVVKQNALFWQRIRNKEAFLRRD